MESDAVETLQHWTIKKVRLDTTSSFLGIEASSNVFQIAVVLMHGEMK